MDYVLNIITIIHLDTIIIYIIYSFVISVCEDIGVCVHVAVNL